MLISQVPCALQLASRGSTSKLSRGYRIINFGPVQPDSAESAYRQFLTIVDGGKWKESYNRYYKEARAKHVMSIQNLI